MGQIGAVNRTAGTAFITGKLVEQTRRRRGTAKWIARTRMNHGLGDRELQPRFTLKDATDLIDDILEIALKRAVSKLF